MDRDRERENVSTTRLMMEGDFDREKLREWMRELKPAPTIASLLLPRMGEMSNEELGARAAISRSTVYKIFKGEMRPDRDPLIRIAFVLGMEPQDAQQLLKTSQRGALTANERRDVLLIYGLRNHCTLEEMDELLREFSMKPLLPEEQRLSDFLGPRLGLMQLDELARRARLDPEAVAYHLGVKRLPRERAARIEDWEKDDLLRIAFALGFNRERTQQLLAIAHRAYLNSKAARDAAIIEGLEAGITLEEMDARLAALGLKPLAPAAE